MQMSNDDWYALMDKIDMIPDKELANNMRKLFVLTEASIQRGWDKPDEKCYLRNFIDFILLKNNNTNKGQQLCR